MLKNPGTNVDPVIVPEDARRTFFVRLKNVVRQGIRTKIRDKPDQGKFVSVSCRSHYSNYFMVAGNSALEGLTKVGPGPHPLIPPGG